MPTWPAGIRSERGESWSGVHNLTTVPVFNDARIVYTFHYYDPFNFTHQGAPWITPALPTGVTFGSNAEKADLANNVTLAQNFMTRTGRPLFMGEYGAWEGISLPQRVDYYKTVHDARRLLRAHLTATGYLAGTTDAGMAP